jgi:hypothetical protein
VHGIKQQHILPLQTIFPSVPSLPTDGIFMRRTDTRMKAVAWGTVSSVATPQRRVKEWCTKNPRNDAEEIVHSQMKSCTGVPVYRVVIKTKSNKGSGSRGCCAECNMQTNIFCIVCKRWLCDPQLAANRSQKNGCNQPKFI